MAKEIKETDCKKRFMNGFQILCRSRHSYTVWSDCMALFAITLANTSILPLNDKEPFKSVWQQREQRYLNIIKGYDKKEQKLFPQMFALLVEELGKTVHKEGYASVYDPTCGAGATLISASEQCKEMFKKYNYQNHVYFVGQDVDITCVYMCYIQLALHGLAGYVIHGNTLMKPEPELPKDLENIYFTPIWFSDVWAMRRLFHNQDILGRKLKHGCSGN